jgi:hypothetical protein
MAPAWRVMLAKAPSALQKKGKVTMRVAIDSGLGEALELG